MSPEAQLKKEGFKHVYTWHDEPNAQYGPHSHKGKVAFFILNGSVKFNGDIEKEVIAGERFDVPVGVEHSAKVGPKGCDWIVGEMIEGDS